MRKPGRPKKNGMQPSILFRSVLVLEAYHQARSSGSKHCFAIPEAVAAVKKDFPGMPISETEVKRVLAERQPKGDLEALVATKVSNSGQTTLTFGFAARPEYPRINARPPASKK